MVENNQKLQPLVKTAALSCINPNVWFDHRTWSPGTLTNFASSRRLFKESHQPNRRSVLSVVSAFGFLTFWTGFQRAGPSQKAGVLAAAVATLSLQLPSWSWVCLLAQPPLSLWQKCQVGGGEMVPNSSKAYPT